jgi:hypothetical protein
VDVSRAFASALAQEGNEARNVARKSAPVLVEQLPDDSDEWEERAAAEDLSIFSMEAESNLEDGNSPMKPIPVSPLVFEKAEVAPVESAPSLLGKLLTDSKVKTKDPNRHEVVQLGPRSAFIDYAQQAAEMKSFEALELLASPEEISILRNEKAKADKFDARLEDKEEWFEGWRLRFQKAVLSVSGGKGASLVVDTVGLGPLTHAAIEACCRRARVRLVDSMMTSSVTVKNAEPIIDEDEASYPPPSPTGASSLPSQGTTNMRRRSSRKPILSDESTCTMLSEVGLDLRTVLAKQLDLRAISSMDISSEHGASILRHISPGFGSLDKSSKIVTGAVLSAPKVDACTQAFNLKATQEAFKLVAKSRSLPESSFKNIQCAVICPSGIEMLN